MAEALDALLNEDHDFGTVVVDSVDWLDPTWFECRFCDHHAACHNGGGAAMTCRSCLHATPVDGGWHCARHDRMLMPAEQRAACGRHLFIPDLIPGEVIDAGDDVVTYRMADGSTWTNDARSPEAAPC